MLDPEWGKGHGRDHDLDELVGQRGEDWIDSKGESWLIWESIDKCMNSDCDAANRYRYIPAKLSFENPYHPEDRKEYKIKSRRYGKGKHTEEGVFILQQKGVWKPIKIELGTRGVGVDITAPWVFITTGEFKDEIPPAWTVLPDGRVKSNMNSKRYRDIVRWFAARQIRLEELHIAEDI